MHRTETRKKPFMERLPEREIRVIGVLGFRDRSVVRSVIGRVHGTRTIAKASFGRFVRDRNRRL